MPDGCVVIGPAEQTVSNRGNDNDAASRADFEVRAIVPQPISGTVRDDDGAPVAGVDGDPAPVRGGPATTTTAADGSYVFDNNPIGTGYTVTIVVPAGYTAGPGGTQIGGIAVTNAPSRRGRTSRWSTCLRVSGTVTGGGSGLGSGPGGAHRRRRWQPVHDCHHRQRVLRGGRAATGDYSLEVIPPDGWTTPGPQDITVPTGGLTGQDIALTRPGALGGAVTTDGAPSAGVTVAVDGPGGPLTLQTDTDGRYFVDDLPPGSYTITITVPGGTTATGPTTRTVTITAAGEVRGGQDFTLTTARAEPNRATTAQDVDVTVDVVGNDTPGTGQTFDLTSVVLTSPSATNGGRTLTVPGEGVYTIDSVTGAVTFDPEPGFSGQATPVGYQVSDTNGSTFRSTVTITVTLAVPPVPPVSPVPPVPPLPPVPPVPDDDVDLVLDKRAVSGTQARVGGTVRYKLTVRNKGTDAASRSTTLVDRLPAGLELVAARSRSWACTTRKAADTVSCV